MPCNTVVTLKKFLTISPKNVSVMPKMSKMAIFQLADSPHFDMNMSIYNIIVVYYWLLSALPWHVPRSTCIDDSLIKKIEV